MTWRVQFHADFAREADALSAGVALSSISPVAILATMIAAPITSPGRFSPRGPLGIRQLYERSLDRGIIVQRTQARFYPQFVGRNGLGVAAQPRFKDHGVDSAIRALKRIE